MAGAQGDRGRFADPGLPEGVQARAQLLDDFSTPFLETLRNPVLQLPQKLKKAGKMFESMTGVDDALTLDLRRAQRTYAGAMGVFSYE